MSPKEFGSMEGATRPDMGGMLRAGENTRILWIRLVMQQTTYRLIRWKERLRAQQVLSDLSLAAVQSFSERVKYVQCLFAEHFILRLGMNLYNTCTSK